MNRLIRQFLSIVSAAGLLAGCALIPATPAPPPDKMAHVRIESVKHAVIFAEGVTTISKSEGRALAAFVGTIHPSAVSSVALAADDKNPRSLTRAYRVRNYLIAHGFDPKSILLTPTAGIDGRTVVLDVQYAVGIPPQDCPDWHRGSTGNFENSDSSDFGCSYYNNMIVQLANPADFDEGHGTPTYDGMRESAPIQHYMSGAPSSSASGSSGASGGASSAGAGASSAGGASSSPATN